MMQESSWELISDKQWLFSAYDNSPIDELLEKVSVDDIFFSTPEMAVNLGIKKINGHLYSGNYVGICRLKGKNNFNLFSQDGKEIIIQIKPRFDMSVVEMLDYIKNDDEFERYLAPQNLSVGKADNDVEDYMSNELFVFFDQESPIKISDNICRNSSVITATVYLCLLRELCRKPLMGRMLSIEENLNGKVKGKIVLKQNIKKNSLKGRDDRVFCRYLQYSEDIPENQLLKNALSKTMQFLNAFFRTTTSQKNSYREMGLYCQRALMHVTNKRVSRQDLVSSKVSGLYAYYKPVVSMARMILSEVSLQATGGIKTTGFVIPYAISMNRLFEIYVRTFLKKSGVRTYPSDENRIQILKYDFMSRVLKNSEKGFSNYIQGSIKPDIVLFNPMTGKYAVFDVKYKHMFNRKYARADRLQILAYTLMYNCDHVGIIFPTENQDNGNSFYMENGIDSFETRDRFFHQCEIAISSETSPIMTSKEDQHTYDVYQYFESLLS